MYVRVGRKSQDLRLPRRLAQGARRSGHAEQRPTARLAVRPSKRSGAPEAERRHAGPPQDHATYSCSCGYVFKADVSTTVECPHCGTGQAW